jgi:acyl-CoA synthetase (AMP-forming)/AMP-acid ligase II
LAVTANLGDFSARSAARFPRREAIVDVPNARRLTFAELDARANRLAAALRGEFALSYGDRVAILSTNSAEVAEVFFACAKAGLVAQPMNWRLAPLEQQKILANGEPRALIFHEDFRPMVAELQRLHDLPHWVGFAPGAESEYEDVLARQPSDASPTFDEINGDDPCLILYTGGTTGIPKGAVHSHNSAIAAIINQTVAERVTTEDKYMLLGQMFHIPVLLAINYLGHGRPLVLMNFEPRATLEVIEAEGVTAFLGITTMLNYLMGIPDFDRYDLSSLRLIQYGGGPMAASVVKDIMEAFPCELQQGYGQTEGGTMSFLLPWVHREISKGLGTHRAASCGQEAYLTSIRIVDEAGVPVPRDGTAVGEIVVKSPANMVGYWRNPEVTIETFRDGGGFMRTGDLATWDEDGFIYIVDRAKDMVISGGENIYPAQVEACIYRHPAVLECAVIGVPDSTWGEALKAIVVLKEGAAATEAEIIDLTRRELASYMKPKSIDFVQTLPKGPTGKILKRELRAPYWEGRARQV